MICKISGYRILFLDSRSRIQQSETVHECNRLDNYTLRYNEVERGVYWYHLVRPSVCPSVDRIVSALYLQQYLSDPFHICTSYQATSEGVSRVMPISKFFKFVTLQICNFDFWLGIQYDSMVWVILRRQGVSSERRRSSCSSFWLLVHFDGLSMMSMDASG